MTKKSLVAVLGAAAMTMSAGAMAQGVMAGAYIGLEVGQAHFGPEDDTAWKILGGYKFHPNLAAEIAYSQLLDKRNADVTALELVAVGSFPVANQISLLGKLGLANVDASPGGDKTELTYGLGVQYDLTLNLGIRGQWQRYNTDEEVDLFTIGVVWKF